jgi:glucan biosynthesis protein C
MTPTLEQQRLHFIDHLRGFMFIIMAVDHALHAYAFYWGRFWFFKDYDRSIVFDAFYLHDQSIIMPMLFFIMGMFVIPSLYRRGLLGYLKERFIKLGIPFLVGIPFIVPLLSYPRYEHYQDQGISLFEFWTKIFFFEKLQAGPYWVQQAMFFYGFILLFIYKILPWIFKGFKAYIVWALKNPIAGYISFGLISSVILGLSDLMWGAPWWVGLNKLFELEDSPYLNSILKLFSLQGSRFLLVLLYCFTGAAISTTKIFYDQGLMERLSKSWLHWMSLMIGLGVLYVGYSLSYIDDGAYSEAIHHYFDQGGHWSEAGPLMCAEAPMVLIRTTLHGFFCLAQVITLLAIFKRFYDKSTPLWTSLAINAYGIFMLHDPIMIWMQYGFIATELPILIKFLITAVVGIGAAWILNDKIFRKLPGFRRILDPEGIKRVIS